MSSEEVRLSKIYGHDKVFDFSLGNPNSEPREIVQKSMLEHLLNDSEGLHKYMNNAGFEDVREKIAKSLELESNVKLTHENIIMVVGAAGGLNVVLKSILSQGEEVIVFAPYFMEYNFYIDNHGGKIVVIPADTKTFEPNLNLLKEAITSRTKAVIINNPNNPSGVVYSEEVLKRMSEILEDKEREFKSSIFVISDEPYSKLVYDDVKVPQVLGIFKNAVIVNSYSKSLGLAGERIGYIAASSKIENIELLVKVLSFTNRTLGFVNAPALFQKVIGDCFDVKVNIEEYLKRRNFLYENLIDLGFECIKPQGDFYLFPKSPISNDIEFIKEALKYNIILVPGTAFGCPGYFRISYSVDFKIIERSIPAFRQLANEFIHR